MGAPLVFPHVVVSLPVEANVAATDEGDNQGRFIVLGPSCNQIGPGVLVNGFGQPRDSSPWSTIPVNEPRLNSVPAPRLVAPRPEPEAPKGDANAEDPDAGVCDDEGRRVLALP